MWMLFRKVLKEEETQGKAQVGYLPKMTLANIVTMNAESFRTLSCEVIVTDLLTCVCVCVCARIVCVCVCVCVCLCVCVCVSPVRSRYSVPFGYGPHSHFAGVIKTREPFGITSFLVSKRIAEWVRG